MKRVSRLWLGVSKFQHGNTLQQVKNPSQQVFFVFLSGGVLWGSSMNHSWEPQAGIRHRGDLKAVDSEKQLTVASEKQLTVDSWMRRRASPAPLADGRQTGGGAPAGQGRRFWENLGVSACTYCRRTGASGVNINYCAGGQWAVASEKRWTVDSDQSPVKSSGQLTVASCQ